MNGSSLNPAISELRTIPVKATLTCLSGLVTVNAIGIWNSSGRRVGNIVEVTDLLIPPDSWSTGHLESMEACPGEVI